VVLLVIVLMPAQAAAQVAVGTLLGNVTDESGGAVPGATITATEVRTNISRTAVSNAAGHYTFTNIAPGVYRVDGELVGFKKFTRESVEVNVNTTVRVDMALAVGTLEESVVVTGEAPMLQTDRTDTGRIIESTQITQMPLGFNRNFQALLITVPGASRPFRPHSEFYNSQDSLSSNINGQGRQSNNVQLEGADNSDNGGNLAFMIPSAEAIDTVAVTTSNYDAEFGRAGGAVTNVTLKTGTNDFRGSAFTFGNTEATVARNPFTTLPPADAKYMQVGFTLGGPIKRNKLFFFGDYVRTNDDSGRLTRGHVPEPAFRTGDFSAAPTRIYDPATGSPNGNGRTQFPGNRIPADRISPIAKRLIDVIPMPNIPGAGVGAINYERPYVREKRTNQGDIKVTYQIAANDLVSVRYSAQNARTYDPATFGIYGGFTKPFSGSGTNPTQSFGVTYNRVWSPTLVQEVRLGRTHHHNEAIGEDYGLKTSDEFGIRGVNLNAFSSGITTINVGGYADYLIGFETSLPWDREESTWTYATTATKIWGDHTVKIGGDLRMNRHMLDQVNHPRGEWTFRGAQTAIPTDSAAQNGYANSLASFLLDVPQEIERGLVSETSHRGGTHTALYTYVHDKWQVRPDVTLDLGLRHELYTPLVGFTPQGGQATYDPDTNTVRVAGFGDIPENLGVKTYWANFNPRTGVSWRINDTNVFRAGYGVSALPWPSSYGQDYPVRQIQQLTAPSFGVAGSLAAGIPPPTFVTIPDSGILDATPLPALSLSVVPVDRREGQLHSWNVAYQRSLPGGFTAEIAYVGNRGKDILKSIDLNAGYTLGADQAGRPLRVKYGRTASNSAPIAVKSTYNSMQVKLDRRMRGGLSITNSYTLGRGYSYTNGDGTGGTIATPADIERSWQRTSFDSTHNFASSFLYLLPWGPDGRWLRDGALGRALGDWQITGIFSAISGTPIDFTASATGLRAPGNSQTPDASGKPKVLGGIGSGALWFDTSVFSAAAQNTWGNVERRGLLTGPAYVNLDASIVKIFRIGSRRAEVRVDMFNALNIAHYANPNGALGNGNFGRVTAILPLTERMIRFGGRVLF